MWQMHPNTVTSSQRHCLKSDVNTVGKKLQPLWQLGTIKVVKNGLIVIRRKRGDNVDYDILLDFDVDGSGRLLRLPVVMGCGRS